MGTLKVKDPADPTGATWINVGAVGPQGPVGPTGPEGPPSNEVAVGPDDPLALSPLVDVWYDTDEPDPPPVGADQFMLKAGVHARHIAGAVTSGATEVTWTLKAGSYLCLFQCSGVASGTGIKYVNLDMSTGGTFTNVGQSKHYFNVINNHHMMNCGVSVVTIPADGDYPFRLSISTGLTMDANDFGHFTLIPCLPGAVSA